MSLYKRKTVWWIRFTTPDGRRVRRSTGIGDRTQAQEYHDQVKAELWRAARLGEKPKRHWREAVVRWLNETSHKATHEMDKYHLRWLDAHLGDLTLDDITRDVIDRIKQAKKDQGASNATVNRMLSVPRAILRRAELDWEWLNHAPKVRLLPEPRRRVRWLHQEEAERLIAELPKHLKAMARFTLATGLRQGNVKGLRWSQVDLDRRIVWIHADQAKARKAIAVPLNAEAMKVLQSQLGKNPSYVFTYGGRPVKQVNTKARKAALRRAGIKDFRWHDLRHTWASWHVRQGTPLHVLQDLGGWETVDMVRRYAHLAAEHTAQYAERVSRSFAENDHSAGTNLAHAERSDASELV